MKTLSKYLLFGAVAAGFWSCSSEESVEELQTSGRTVQLTVNVSREGDNAATRTEMSEANGGADLGCVWTSGDKLLVTDAQGNAKGLLTLSAASVGQDLGTFSGDLSNVTNGEIELNFIYLGTEWSKTATPAKPFDDNATSEEGTSYLKYSSANKSVTVDYSIQGGNIKSLTDKDILAEKAQVTVTSGSEYALVEEPVNLKRKISFAKFSLSSIQNYKNDLNYSELGYVAVSGEGLMKSLTLNVADLSVSAAAGDVLVKKHINTDDYDFYMVLLPGETEPKPIQVSVSNGDDVYTGTYMRTAGAKIVEGKYYRKDLGSNQYAGLPLTDWSTKKNPGNMEPWGVEKIDIDPKGIPFSPVFASVYGWQLNSGNSYNVFGGYCRAIEYTNGLHNGLLTSKGTSCFYYQWGRYLGFPSNCATGNTTILNASIIDRKVGYYRDEYGYQGAGIPVKYLAKYMGNESDDDLQRSLDWSIVFGQTNNDYLDYIYGNTYNENWYKRSPDPCPTGWRLPTYKELSVFIPSTFEVDGSYAEIKIVDGIKYAFKWVVGKSNGIYYLDVTSVRTEENSVSVNYSGFNTTQAKTKRIYAYGLLYNNGVNYLTDWTGNNITYKSWGNTAAYWSIDSGDNIITGVNGQGGKALYIEFENNSAIFKEVTLPFGYGVPVMALEDDSAVETSIKPMLPYGGDDYTILPGYKK